MTIISSTPMLHQSPAIDQLDMREVGDEIRYLGIGNAKLTSLIENKLFKNGKEISGKGLIGKRSVKNMRFEQYTRQQRPYQFKVAAGSGTEIESTGITLEDVNGLPLYFTLFNATNQTECRVESINTSTKVVKGTSVGATTFSVAAGDYLVLGAGAYPEGSTESTIINGTDDQNFNTLQLSRWSVAISWVLEATKQMAGGNRLTREKMYMVWEALADMERTLILGQISADAATKNTTTGAQSGYTDEFPTTKGIWNLAATTYDMQGQITLEKIRKDIPLAQDDSVNDAQMYIAFCGNNAYARIMEEMNQGHQNQQPAGMLKKWGIRSDNIVTSGPEIQLVKHNTFNIPGMDNKMLIFAPENLGYVHLEGHDVRPNNAIQTNAAHSKQDELYAYYGIETLDAGKSIMTVTNLF